ncbi:MAG: alcohol dehydrogenase catalytic domain-containing protein [Coriobacteriales bacterium]|nr:alcohol dehydrogenase catalytic domain-containing protein [Coriobacteriales bacterium]
MKSLAVTRPGDLRETDPDKKCIIEILDVDEPQVCGPTEVKIKIAYCAICASDPHVAMNCFNREVPYGMGHEISGIIVDMGPEVKTKGLKIGDRVAGNFLRPCGWCYHCQNGHPEFCKHFIDEGTAPGYAQYVVWDESQVWKIPDDITLRTACMLEPTSIAVRAVDKCNVMVGNRVAVQGGGPIGQLTLQVLKMRGATSLTIIEPIEKRRELAKKSGADYAIDPFNSDVVEESMKITGGLGFDVVVEVTGNSKCTEVPLQIVAEGGTILYLGMYNSEYEMPLNIQDVLYTRNVTITGTKVAPYCFPRALQMLKRMQLEDFTGAVFPLDNAVEAFEEYFKMNNLKVIICCNEDIADL